MKIQFNNYWKLNKNSFGTSLRSNKIFKLFGVEWWEEGWADWKKRNNFLEVIIINFSVKISW